MGTSGSYHGCWKKGLTDPPPWNGASHIQSGSPFSQFSLETLAQTYPEVCFCFLGEVLLTIEISRPSRPVQWCLGHILFYSLGCKERLGQSSYISYCCSVFAISNIGSNSRSVTCCRMKFHSVTRHRQAFVPGDYNKAKRFPLLML